MESFALLEQLIAGATIVIGLAGCFLLHFRQRSGPSLSFLLSVLLLNAWIFLRNLLSGYSLDGTAVPGLALMHQANEMVVAALSLFATVSFAVAMHRIASPSKSGRDSA
jgi:hypothetical protein